MQRQFFGTDGIRGAANQFPMTPDIALKVGMAAGLEFKRGDHRHSVVIGKDTRLSGYMLEPALTAGFIAVGMDVILVGPMPTPAVAMLTKSLRADIGVMISASHNPYQDNGIKLFDPEGAKLTDAVEYAIEERIQSSMESAYATPDKLGRARRLEDAPGRYIEFVKNTFPKGKGLEGLKIVIDCANGAAYRLGGRILWELGAEVIECGVSPNGFNINDGCGSTQPELVSGKVLEHKADIGIALDGDADRLIICDEKGALVDGDQLMALIAESWHRQGKLNGKGIVATSMSNLGLEYFLKEQGLALERTNVGDRYVTECMREKGYNIGGEQSGHIILRDYNTTGDGLVAALQVLAELVQQQAPASVVCNKFKPFPQLLKNVRYTTGEPLNDPKVQLAIKEGEEILGKRGRIFIRKSGTEPLIRVMAEGEDEKTIHKVVEDITNELDNVINS